MSSPWLWYLSRAADVVTLSLVTLTVLLGLLTSARWPPRHSMPAIAVGLHRTLALGTPVFLAIHILTAVLDTYVDIGWVSVVVPFTAGYETQWVGLGTIAFDILLTLIVTSLLRHRLPARAWRALHWLSYAMAPVAIAHASTMATTDEPALFAVTVACGVAMTLAVAWRIFATDRTSRNRRRAIASQEWS